MGTPKPTTADNHNPIHSLIGLETKKCGPKLMCFPIDRGNINLDPQNLQNI